MKTPAVCRICADINLINEDIFENNSLISELIFKYLSISIEAGDELSTKICIRCKETICNFHEFALQCERAQNFLLTCKENVVRDYDCVQNFESKLELQIQVKEEDPFINSDDDNYADVDHFESPEEIIKNDIKEEIDPLKKIVKPREKRKRLKPKKRRKTRRTPLKKENTSLPIKNEIIDDLTSTELHNDVLKINGNSINIKKEKITDIETIRAILEFCKNNNVDIEIMNICRRSLKKAYICEMFKFNCHVCCSKFSDWNSLQSHTKSNHMTEPEIICICLKKIRNLRAVQRHWVKHSPDNRWRCDDCSKTFSSKTEFNKHVIIHKEKGPLIYNCEKCEKKFSTILQLDRHKKIHLPPEERFVWDCKLCDRKFEIKSQLKYHIQFYHEKLRPFICDTCGRSFRLKTDLIEHNTTHAEEMNFICEKCNKAFKTKRRLNRHMSIHSTITYPCPHCPVILSSRDTLKNHLYLHDENAKHTCPLCNKTFKRKKDVTNHKKIHTGERPYSCLWCPKTFSQASNYNLHKRTVHPIESQGQEKSRYASDKIRQKPIIKLKTAPPLK